MHKPEAETKFFYELTPLRILAAVERLGFRCTGRCFSLHSMENRVYEVEIEVEEEASLKSPSERFRVAKFYRPGRWSREQILEEHQFLFDLIEHQIPVVAPLRSSDGESLFKLDEAEIWFAVFPKQGGRSPSELKDEELTQVGRLLARMHTVGASKIAKYRMQLNPDTYGMQNLKYLVDSGKLPVEFRPHYVQLVESIYTLITPWFSGIPNHRIHGDAHFGNLLWGRDGAFWVDFDDMLRGPAVQDLWLIVIGRDKEAKRQMEVLLTGYESMRSFDRGTLALIEPLRTLRMINYTAWIAKRWDDPAFQRTFPQFGSIPYWREQVSDLQEQLSVLQGGGGAEMEAFD